jgi:hypothetical protein
MWKACVNVNRISFIPSGIQITLPPLIEDTEGREIVATGLRKSRARYRQFRSRLSQEVMQSKGE